MDVPQQRTAIARRLRRVLPDDHMIVVAPDHPLLLRSPDLLVGGGGRLLAIMCGSSVEVRRPNLAWARLTLARAALPPETVFGFAAVPSTDALAQRLSGGIDEAVGIRDVEDLTRVSADGGRPDRTKDRMFAREKAMARFGTNYRIAQRIGGGGDGKPREPGTRVRFERRIRYEGRVSGVDKAEVAAANSADMVNLSFQGAETTFDLQDGVAWTNGDSGVAYLPEIPEARGDPQRFVRANAFAGWVLAPERLEPQHARIADMILSTGSRR